MNNDDTITIRQGETLQLPVTADDDSAVSVQLQVEKDGTIYIDETEPFVDGRATIRTDDTDTLVVAEYRYMLTITYSDGVVDKMPDASDCDGDCDLPKFIVCEGIVEGS